MSLVSQRSTKLKSDSDLLLYPPGLTTCDRPFMNQLTHSPNLQNNQYQNEMTNCNNHEVVVHTNSAFLKNEIGDQRKNLSNNSPTHFTESNIDKELCEVREKVAVFTKNMVDLNSNYTVPKWKQNYKISSLSDALTKALLLIARTEVKKVPADKSYGHYLANNVHATVYSHTLQSSTMDEVANICTDAQRGDVVFKEGTQIGCVEIGQILSAGITEIDVYRKPRIVVLSFGVDLVN